nr:MAG TPA: homing endonuclease [Caudoviricetes sp.]
MQEQWKDIPGYEGLYEASNTGEIRTKLGKTTSSARSSKRVWKQRILKQKHQKRIRCAAGYTDARVTLWKDGEEKTMLVSRLVAMAWIPGYSKNLTVNHIDGNPMNNNASNLEWCTRAENIRKGFANGQYKNTGFKR